MVGKVAVISPSLSFYIIGDLRAERASNLKENIEIAFPGCPIFANAIFPNDTDFRHFSPSFRTQVRLARPPVPGEWGCSLSHKWAYDHFLSSDATRAVILEDDALLCQEFSMEKLFEVSRGGVITLLGYHEPSPWKGPIVTRFPSTGTFGYTIDRPAAKKLLRLHSKERQGVSIPADWPVSLDLRFSHASPALVTHPSRDKSQSTIGDRNASPFARLVSLMLTTVFPLDAALRLARFYRLRMAARVKLNE